MILAATTYLFYMANVGIFHANLERPVNVIMIQRYKIMISSAVLHHDAMADLRSKCDPWYRSRCHLDSPGDPKDSNNI